MLCYLYIEILYLWFVVYYCLFFEKHSKPIIYLFLWNIFFSLSIFIFVFLLMKKRHSLKSYRMFDSVLFKDDVKKIIKTFSLFFSFFYDYAKIKTKKWNCFIFLQLSIWWRNDIEWCLLALFFLSLLFFLYFFITIKSYIK